MMSRWIERYVASVRNYLPMNVKQDVSEELTSLLEERFQTEQEHKGGPLTEEEQKAILKQLGHPVKVAAGYGNTRSLISEEVFPLYKVILKIALFQYFAVAVLINLLGIYNSAEPQFAAFVSNVLSFTMHLFVWTFALFTLLFSVLDQQIVKLKVFESWNPASLPRSPGKWINIPIIATVIGIIAGIVFLALINDLLVPASAWSNDHHRIIFNPELLAIRPWVNVIMVGSLLLKFKFLFQPYWTTWTLLFDSLLNLLSLWAVYLLLQMKNAFVTVIYRGMEQDPAAIQQVNQYSELWFKIVLLIFSLVMIYELIRNAYRVYLLKKD